MRESGWSPDDITLGTTTGLGTDRWATLDDGVRLHYVEAGKGPLVVLLHGFPQYWGAWRHQIPALVAAGHRVVTPDLRGYNLSDKPEGIARYDVARLAWDVVRLVEHCGERRAAIVGHDWGGAIAWYFAARHPQHCARLAILNAPHPRAFLRALRATTQPLRSWYVGFFQLPWLPEAVFRAFDFALLARVLRRGPARRGAFDEAEIARHKAALGRPGALTAAINYYRAAARRAGRRAREAGRRVTCPTLVIWGMRDAYLHPSLIEGLDAWVPDVRVVRLDEATHWVMEDAPERVNAELVRFLAAP